LFAKIFYQLHAHNLQLYAVLLYNVDYNAYVYGSLGREDGCRCDRNT